MKDDVPEDDEHLRPDGVDNATVQAVGKVTEALERIERARGALYEFHQLIGGADIMLQEAAFGLEEGGHDLQATQLRQEIIGRNVLPGRWTFQIVEEFDDDYYAACKLVEAEVRAALLQGRRHVYESELKEANRTHGYPGHESRP